MSAVSMNVTPRSSARRIVAIDSSQSAAPYHSLIPMQPRPWAETVKSPSATSRMSVSLLRRTHSAAVDPYLVVEQLQALLPLGDRLQDELAVTSEQVEPLGLSGSRTDQLGVALHVAYRHAGSAQLAQHQQPVHVAVAEPAPPVRAALNPIEQADPLVPPQCVLAEAALLGCFPRGPCCHEPRISMTIAATTAASASERGTQRGAEWRAEAGGAVTL